MFILECDGDAFLFSKKGGLEESQEEERYFLFENFPRKVKVNPERIIARLKKLGFIRLECPRIRFVEGKPAEMGNLYDLKHPKFNKESTKRRR